MVRFLVIAAVVFGAALLAALGLTIVDLYLTGHSLPSLGREVLAVPALGIALSPSDIVMLVATVGAGWTAWWATRRRSRDG